MKWRTQVWSPPFSAQRRSPRPWVSPSQTAAAYILGQTLPVQRHRVSQGDKNSVDKKFPGQLIGTHVPREDGTLCFTCLAISKGDNRTGLYYVNKDLLFDERQLAVSEDAGLPELADALPEALEMEIGTLEFPELEILGFVSERLGNGNSFEMYAKPEIIFEGDLDGNDLQVVRDLHVARSR